jgi:hypothetical protein
MLNKTDWFTNTFGFSEKKYDETQKILKDMYLSSQKKKLCGINVGTFKQISGNDLANFQQKNQQGEIFFENIIADIKQIHKIANSENATIQVASQLNCLEMANPYVTVIQILIVFDM